METFLLLIMLISVMAVSRKDTKRLVLDGETDLAAEITTLKADVQRINADLEVKEQTIQHLQMEVQTKFSAKGLVIINRVLICVVILT